MQATPTKYGPPNYFFGGVWIFLFRPSLVTDRSPASWPSAPDRSRPSAAVLHAFGYGAPHRPKAMHQGLGQTYWGIPSDQNGMAGI